MVADKPNTLADKMAELTPERRARVEAETERLRAEMDETEFLMRGNNRAWLEASIANLIPRGEAITTAEEYARWTAKGSKRFDIEGSYEGKLYRISVGPVESGTDEERQAYLDEIQKILQEPDASPFVQTKTGRIEDLTEEDLEGFEFLDVEHEPGDAAVVAKAIQDMSLEEKIAIGRSMLEGVESHLDEAIEGGPFWEDYDVTPQEPTPEAIERGRELMDRLVPVPGSRMVGRFDAQDTPPEVISELRAFIDSLDDGEEEPDVHR